MKADTNHMKAGEQPMKGEQPMRLLVLNGPNLNLLGRREPEVYGTLTLDELNRLIATHAQTLNAQRAARPDAPAHPDAPAPAPTTLPPVKLVFFQSNHEGLLIDTIQNAPRHYDGIMYNPAAHTHYSLALRDAVAAVPTPVVEVHLSDITAREDFRRHSVIAEVCLAQFYGKGAQSYIEALEFLVRHLDGLAES